MEDYHKDLKVTMIRVNIVKDQKAMIGAKLVYLFLVMV
jgi:hypothetical protein